MGVTASDSAGAMVVDKDEDKDVSTIVSASANTESDDKDENIGGDFDNTVVDKISQNVGKQLKMSEFKLFVTIINHKKSHLLKIVPATKLSQPFPIALWLSQIQKAIILISLFIVHLLTQIGSIRVM